MSPSKVNSLPQALLIEAADRPAGVAVRERSGFSFFAADPHFYALDGSRFSRIEQVEKAVQRIARQIRQAANTPGRKAT